MPELPNLLRQRLAGTKNGVAQVHPEATIPKATEHPDADTLTAYVEQLLSASERQTVVAHLAVCEPCREVVVLSQPELSESATQTVLAPAPVSPWRRLLRPAFGLAASLAAMAIIAVMVLRLPQKSAQQAANQAAPQAQQTQGTPLQDKEQATASEQPQAAASASPANNLSASAARMELDRNTNEARAQMKSEAPAKAKVASPSMASPPPPVPALTATFQKKDYVNTDFFAPSNADSVVLAGQSRNDFPSAPQPQTAAAGTLFSANSKITGFSDIPANAAGNSSVRILTPNPPSKPLTYKLGQLASATVHSLHLHTNIAPNLRAGALGASTMGEPGSFSATLLKNPTAEVKAAPEKADAGSLAASEALSPGALSAPGFTSRASMPTSWKVVGGKLIKSAGQSQWEEAYPGAGFEFSIVTVRGNDVWAGGSNASIIHSRDGGLTWETVRLGEAATGTIVSIMAGALNVQVKTSDNQLWSSTDAGKTWSLRAE
jgi:uncharacterized protein YaiE (UPF0345 family)